jgi:hypothetical protein
MALRRWYLFLKPVVPFCGAHHIEGKKQKQGIECSRTYPCGRQMTFSQRSVHLLCIKEFEIDQPYLMAITKDTRSITLNVLLSDVATETQFEEDD